MKKAYSEYHICITAETVMLLTDFVLPSGERQQL